MAHSPARSSTRNLVMSDPDREQRVRERAYLLWEAEGKPHGRDVEFWERARELVSQNESAGAASPNQLKPQPDKPFRAKPQTSVKSADLSADQSESGSAPRKRARAKPRKTD